MKFLEMEAKVVSRGNSFALRIPRALIDCKILKKGRKYKIIFKEIKMMEGE